jgi:Flp pilus assembly protein TadD/peroxiredoxin
VIMMKFLRTVVLSATIFVTAQLFFIIPLGATLQGLQVGIEAPSFSLKSISGEPKAISGLIAQKLTVIVFWSTWSSNSEKALLMLEKLYQKYRSAGLAVIAINVDGQKSSEQVISEIRLKVATLKISYPVLIDSGLMTFHDYGVIAVPSTVVLDKERIIRYELSGFPLVGSEEMVDYISSTLDGKKPADIVTGNAAYKPDKKAVRSFNMGKNAMTSRSSADTAEMWFKKAIESDPKFVAPYLGLGNFYLQKNETSLARGSFEQALSLEPGNQIALCELALLLINGGKLKEGKTLIEKALHQKGTYPPCYYYLGSVYAKEGKSDEAFKVFDDAIQVNPLDPKVYIYKGRVCEENGMLQQAALAYKKALELIIRE